MLLINLSQEGFKIFLCSLDIFHFHWIDMHLISFLLWNTHIWKYGHLCTLAFGMDIKL